MNTTAPSTMVHKQFLLLANALPEVFLLVSPKGKVLAANRAAANFLDLPLQSFAGRPLTDFVRNPSKQITSHLRLWSRTREPLPAPLAWRTQDKSTTRWRSHAFLLRPAVNDTPAYVVVRCTLGKPPTNEFLALNRELEKQRITFHKSNRHRDLLEKEHEKAVVTLRSIGDAVITTDNSNRIEYLNPIAEELTGWTNKEAIGQPLASVFRIINEITRKPAVDPVIRCLEKGHVVELTHSTILVSKDGTEYFIENSAAPIISIHGKTLGAVLVFRDTTGDRVTRRQMEYLAHHDALTNLHNRYYFEQQLEHIAHVAKRSKTEHAMCYIDLDRFKIVNDNAGHVAGDELLSTVARMFAQRVRKGDVLARLGGDEFGVLLYNVNVEQAKQMASSLVEIMADFRFNWEEKIYDLSPSIGIASINEHTVAPAEVMRQADIACYAAKREGRNRSHLYTQEDESSISTVGELNMIGQIREALAKDKFVLYFQPIICISNGIPEMYEVLLRMQGENDELISPSIFIPVAESYGLMVLIDCWVIRKTLEMLATSQQQQDHQPHFTINLSASSLGDPELLSLMKHKSDILKTYPGAVTLEITETAAVGHLEKACEFIRDLKHLGYRFALDDFGSGFSSFVYLKYLPVDYVKIDGAFVRDIVEDPVDQAMVRSINQIAHSLNKKTVAEFVEDRVILEQLEIMGVDYSQGYYTGRPSANPPVG